MEDSNIIEKKVDLLINMADHSTQSIAATAIEDLDAVRSLWTEFGNDVLLKGIFCSRLKPTDTAALYQKSIITEQDLLQIFTRTNFSIPKIVDILRKIPFDHRKRISSQLALLNPAIYDDLDDKIDAKYGMVAGILVKEVSQTIQDQPTDIFQILMDMLDAPEAPLDQFKQYADSVARNQKSEFLLFLQSIFKLKTLYFKETAPIQTQPEFAITVKLAYLICADPDIRMTCQTSIDILQTRLLNSLFLFSEPKSICIILEQLPSFLIHALWDQIALRGRARKPELRNRAIRLQQMIQKEIQSGNYLNISKSIDTGAKK